MPDTANQEPIKSELVEEDPTYVDLVEQFVDGLGNRLQAMRDAIASDELTSVKNLAHQLKGAGGGHGYPILTEVAASLERSADASAVEECKKRIDELASLISRVVVGP